MNFQMDGFPHESGIRFGGHGGWSQQHHGQPPTGHVAGQPFSGPQHRQMGLPQQQQQQHYSPQWYQQGHGSSGHSSTYGNYGNYYSQNVFAQSSWDAAHQALGGEQELLNIFNMEMNRSRVNQQHQAIQSEELHRILNNTPQIRQYYGITWNLELCKIMLAMMDRNPDGFLQWNEFKELLQCIYHWYNTFKKFDFDRSGYIEAHELGQAVQSFGYQVDAKVMETLLRRYSRVVEAAGGVPRCLVAFDDFISLSIRLRAYTDAFRKRDHALNGMDTGSTQFSYSDFLQCIMCL